MIGPAGAPVYDNAKHVRPGIDIPDMLVRNTHLGAALASYFTMPTTTATTLDHNVVLMRGHGMTVVGPTIQECVLRAIYTQSNATIQTTTLLTRAAYQADLTQQGQAMAESIHYLNEEEAEAAMDMTRASTLSTWALWLREVEAAALYINRG